MRRLTLTALMLLVMFSGSLFAQDRTVTYIDRVSDGSASFTNTYDDAAYELIHVSFTAPTAATTNVFTIGMINDYKLPDTGTATITTNTQITSGWYGRIETNTLYSGNSHVVYTNTYTVATTTNNTSVQFYDQDDFPKGWMWEYPCVMTFTFTDTANINLKRVYALYPRP